MLKWNWFAVQSVFCADLAQVRPFSKSWQSFRPGAKLVPLLLIVFKALLPIPVDMQ